MKELKTLRTVVDFWQQFKPGGRSSRCHIHLSGLCSAALQLCLVMPRFHHHVACSAVAPGNCLLVSHISAYSELQTRTWRHSKETMISPIWRDKNTCMFCMIHCNWLSLHHLLWFQHHDFLLSSIICGTADCWHPTIQLFKSSVYPCTWKQHWSNKPVWYKPSDLYPNSCSVGCSNPIFTSLCPTDLLSGDATVTLQRCEGFWSAAVGSEHQVFWVSRVLLQNWSQWRDLWRFGVDAEENIWVSSYAVATLWQPGGFAATESHFCLNWNFQIEEVTMSKTRVWSPRRPPMIKIYAGVRRACCKTKNTLYHT